MIKVLVVDSSALIRKNLSDILGSDSEITVVSTAINGKFAVDKVKKFGPDVVLMDIDLPESDGISSLKEIMNDWPLPVIVLTAPSENSSEKTLEAMKSGAVDFIIKTTDITKIKNELLNKVKSAALARLHIFSKTNIKKHQFFSTRSKIIIIGTSTGGPQTLEALLRELPKNIPAPILIVQHMPPIFTKSLADRLNAICEIKVKEAEEGDELINGTAMIAPGGFHMEIRLAADGFKKIIHLNKEPPELGVRPNVNKLFKSVVPIFKDNTIGVILTGMGMDGTEGCKEIKNFNGTVLAQSEKTCIIYGMPKSVIEANLADEVIDIEDMAVALVQLVDI